MNVSVRDANERIQALIGSRRAMNVAALTDPETPFEPLAAVPATGG